MNAKSSDSKHGLLSVLGEKHAGSSNGRTAVSGTVYRGSSPCPAALSIKHPMRVFLL